MKDLQFYYDHMISYTSVIIKTTKHNAYYSYLHTLKTFPFSFCNPLLTHSHSLIIHMEIFCHNNRKNSLFTSNSICAYLFIDKVIQIKQIYNFLVNNHLDRMTGKVYLKKQTICAEKQQPTQIYQRWQNRWPPDIM